MEQAIDGYFSIDDVIINPKGDVTISGYTPLEIQEIFRNFTNYEDLPAVKLGLKGYDGIWAAALALNKTASDLETKGLERLEDFTYKNADMAKLLFSNAMNTTFIGVRGSISFDKNGDLNAMYMISRLQGGQKQMVGLYYSNKIEWLPDTPVIWKGGVIPKDSVTTIKITRELSSSLYITICCLSGLGIVLTCVFLAFNIGYRKSRIVKMSSPNLNNVTMVGCLILYSAVFWETKGTSTILACEAKLVSLTVGFSLAFGGLFAKTWRVYVIFTHGTKQKKVVKDKQLLLMVCGLVTINLSIIIVWFVIDPFQIVVHQLPVEVNVIDDFEIRESIKHCYSQKQIYFLGCLLTFHGIILLFGVFLALQTRKVKIDGLNDSKMIGVCIYNLVVLSFLGVTVSLTLKFDHELNYGITSCIIIVATTVTQCLIVLPKIIGHFSTSRVHDVDRVGPVNVVPHS
ncbi:gamma-aminobutyric acid type B receptor subunit 2-like [Gigantopelta aegis]|uniref:gamma-aminobutyric acid type B receptor subunit 2-like n=1 Tax=Gigantopelta aegis TaxID=1735272 RepID=UPI001B88C15A|nr:gamma-aminobutyric acid type B receptor subunit 2-like [Gigantopelta aegis]